MLGLMQDRPLLISQIIDYAAAAYPDVEIVTRSVEGPIHRYGYRQAHKRANETGGLSGAPLMNQSTMVLRKLRTRLPDSIPLIGVGGILSGADAVAKMSAGAALVQTYTGLVYRGPELVHDCVEAIRRRRDFPSRGPVAPV